MGHLTQALVTGLYHQHHAKQEGVNSIYKLSSSPKPFKQSITLIIPCQDCNCGRKSTPSRVTVEISLSILSFGTAITKGA